MNIVIFSSSFLYPGNQAWKKINVKKTFCELGDYKILQERKKFDFIVLILFISDFNNKEGTKFDNFNPIIKLLEERANGDRLRQHPKSNCSLFTTFGAHRLALYVRCQWIVLGSLQFRQSQDPSRLIWYSRRPPIQKGVPWRRNSGGARAVITS